MPLNELLKIKTRQNPEGLLNLLIKVATVAILVVVISSCFGFYQVFSGFVIKSAKEDTMHLCQVLIEEQRGYIFSELPDRPVELGLHGSELLPFDSRLRHALAPFNIIKVKIYNPAKQIVYCTDAKLIGKSDINNKALSRALTGVIDSKMVTKDRASDLADEQLRDVDVVETYVPIVAPDNRVIGCFEVYMNMTGYRAQIRHGVLLVTTFLVLVMIGVFGVSYVLMRGGTRQLKAAQAQLEEVAITDALTGTHNRGYLIRRGEEEYERARRKSQSLGCIMLDLDHFKRVNDTYGHLAGDCVLKGVAESLQSMVRPYDVVGRYGGEEFMVLLPDATFEQIMVVASRICELVRSSSYVTDSGELKITVSLGVSCYTKTDRTLNDLIKRADEGLYKAKNDGRDRVAWIYSPGTGDTPM